jgi:hypothetical protein
MLKVLKGILWLVAGVIVVAIIRSLMERSRYTPINDWVEVPMYK